MSHGLAHCRPLSARLFTRDAAAAVVSCTMHDNNTALLRSTTSGRPSRCLRMDVTDHKRLRTNRRLAAVSPLCDTDTVRNDRGGGCCPRPCVPGPDQAPVASLNSQSHPSLAFSRQSSVQTPDSPRGRTCLIAVSPHGERTTPHPPPQGTGDVRPSVRNGSGSGGGSLLRGAGERQSGGAPEGGHLPLLCRSRGLLLISLSRTDGGGADGRTDGRTDTAGTGVRPRQVRRRAAAPRPEGSKAVLRL